MNDLASQLRALGLHATAAGLDDLLATATPGALGSGALDASHPADPSPRLVDVAEWLVRDVTGNQPPASWRPMYRADDLDSRRRQPDRASFRALAWAVALGLGPLDPRVGGELDPGQLGRKDLVRPGSGEQQQADRGDRPGRQNRLRRGLAKGGPEPLVLLGLEGASLGRLDSAVEFSMNVSTLVNDEVRWRLKSLG